jgi:hypothetical protein
MMAMELASTEGFTRSSADVSLRRMVTYSFSPALKQAFEQIYGPPYLARILFAEIGGSQEEDLFVRLSCGFGENYRSAPPDPMFSLAQEAA